MTPISFPETNAILAENQPEYLPLPVSQMGDVTTSCWRLTWRERLKLLLTGQLWLSQMNFREPLQPQIPSADRPFHRMEDL